MDPLEATDLKGRSIEVGELRDSQLPPQRHTEYCRARLPYGGVVDDGTPRGR